jgi:hypothetical protein
VWDKHGDKALERVAQEHPYQFVATRFKLLPKEGTAAVQKTHDFGTLRDYGAC